ncbi:MAG: hypothetical protein JOY77_05950, partial [Alphaproteobacteria bacterium]|nr:hypothetical protein [Alphaproteobacteria bacterium]
LAYAGYIGAGATKLSSAERIWPASQAVREARLSFDFRYGDAKRLLAQVDKGALLEPYSSRTSQKGWMHAYLLARADPTPANIDVAVKAISAFLNPLSALPSIVHLGRIDAAYDYVNRPAVIAWLLRGDTYVLFRVHMRPFLFDRRFMAFADRIGLLRYWQTSGHWPDFCRDKELPYDCQAEARRLHLAKAV